MSSCAAWPFGVLQCHYFKVQLCLAAPERNLKLWPVNISTHAHPCCWSQRVSYVSVLLCQSSHRDAKQIYASLLCVVNVFARCTVPHSKLPHALLYIRDSSNQELSSNFLPGDIDLQLNKEWFQNFHCLSWCVHRLSCHARHGDRAIRHILLEVRLSRESNV